MMSASPSTDRRAVVARTAAALALVASGVASAYVGTFDPEPREYTGPQLVTFVDSHAAPVRCIQLAVQSGDISSAVLGLIAPMGACTREGTDECVIVAPISAGIGQLVAALGALASPNAVLGHELRHCREAHFHPAALPFIESNGK